MSERESGAEAPLPFGQAMDRLEEVVNRLETEQSLELEATLALYEQGVALAAVCRQQLATAQLRLTQIAVPTSGHDGEPA